MNDPELEIAFERVLALNGQSPNEFEITPLPGYTNRNFRLVKPGFDVVLRIPRAATNAHIDRAAEAFNQALAADLGIAPRAQWRADDGLSLTPTLSSTRALRSEDLDDAQTRARLITALRRLHDSETGFQGRIDLAALLEKYYRLLDSELRAEFAGRLQAARQLLPLLDDRDCAYVPSHNDLVLENLMLERDRIWLIDWEFSAMASPYWDLATLCNAASLDSAQSRELLSAYCAGAKRMEESLLFDYRKLLQLLSDIWMAALAN